MREQDIHRCAGCGLEVPEGTAGRLTKPELPAFRGELTVADVSNTETPAEYAEAVRRWAESTWSAYASLHAVARDWARQARMAQSRSGT